MYRWLGRSRQAEPGVTVYRPGDKRPTWIRLMFAVMALAITWYVVDLTVTLGSAYLAKPRADGVVVSVSTTPRGPPRLTVEFRTAQGEPVRFDTPARGRAVGSRVRIAYSAAHPHRARIVGDWTGVVLLGMACTLDAVLIWGAAARRVSA